MAENRRIYASPGVSELNVVAEVLSIKINRTLGSRYRSLSIIKWVNTLSKEITTQSFDAYTPHWDQFY